MRIKTISSMLFLSLFLTGIVSCSSCQTKDKKKEPIVVFKAPVPSSMIVSQEDKMKFMVNSYWNKFDFADTTQISRGDFIENHFYNYVQYLYAIDTALSKKALVKLIETSHQKDSVMFAHFIKMSDKYFEDPNSPFRNEDFHIVVLDYIVNAPNIDEINKVRPRYKLEMAMKNRVGDIASDFTYTLANGKTGKLHNIKADYTLLFFNDPDCPDCQRIKDYISNGEIFKKLILGGEKPNMKVVAMYTDDDIELWKAGVYPTHWINGYDKGRVIHENNIYSIPATPCQYLLDKDKRVILKDAPIEHIAHWLMHKETPDAPELQGCNH